ncbi:hypothetical protein RJT34_09970 [Clitoria ternatea]|uniref:NAB domain-containing protein n=1 Tax=Clitoria ternatea TaxID=43366 RepID=A0AAN9K833_CLITE
MLRRAATNAYSWWWASHIRTKQSKWMEQSIQDMEEKVAEALKIIDGDGETFSQRAEMYYRKRPQLVGFVEEAYRAYRALAERYDLLSKELQSANRTIATVFPEQLTYRMDEDDGEENFHRKNSPSQVPNNQTPKPSIPEVPNIPKKDFRCQSMLLSRKRPQKKIAAAAKYPLTTPSSGPSKAEALAEVDKLQKDILALQTEKEFVRSLYEHSFEKYWEIEDQITEMQKRVCSLEDEFSISTVIEDNDACALMAATALNSCKETLARLQEAQAQSSEEAKAAYHMVKEAHDKFETLRDQFISKRSSQQDQVIEPNRREEGMASLEEEIQEHDVEPLQDIIKENLEEDSSNSLTMSEVAEKTDELVSKIVTLETSVSSQTVSVKKLRSEADELQKKISALEEDKEILLEDSEETKKKLKELEDELRRVKILNQSVKRKDKSLQTHFTESSSNLEHLLGKLNNVKPDEEGEIYENKSAPDGKQKEESEKPGYDLAIMKEVQTTEEKKEDYSESLSDIGKENDNCNLKENIYSGIEGIPELMVQDKYDLADLRSNLHIESLSELDDREKVQLEESKSVLKNYNDVRVKLIDVHMKIPDRICELSHQVKELKSAVETKDKEINILHRKLTCSDANPDESPCTSPENVDLRLQVRELKSAVETKDKEINILQQKLTCSDANPDESPCTSPENVDLHLQVRELKSAVETKDKEINILQKKLTYSDANPDESPCTSPENVDLHLQVRELKTVVETKDKEINILQQKLTYSDSNPYESPCISPTDYKFTPQEALLRMEAQRIKTQDPEIPPSNTNAGLVSASYAEQHQHVSISSRKAILVLRTGQENNKVSNELESGVSFVKELKNEVEKMLEELSQEIGIHNQGCGNEQIKQSNNRVRVPLKSFLFGMKLKKQKEPVF